MISGTRRRHGGRWLRLILQLVSLIAFGLLLWWGGTDAWQQVLSGNPKDILVAFLLLGAASMLAATRLRLISCAVSGQSLASWRRFYYLNMATRVAGLVVPRSLSTFAGKPVALRTLGLSIKRAVWAVLIDNALDLLLLGTWLIPGLLFLQNSIPALTTIALATGLTMLLAGAVWWTTAARRLSPLFRRLEGMSWIVTHLPTASGSAEELLPPRSIALQALGLSILVNGVLGARYHYIARALGLAYPWLLFVAAFPATQLSLVLAVTPGGLGILDAGWYGVLMLGGVPHQEAITFVIAQRAYVSVFVLVWAAISVLLSLTVKEQQHA